MSCDLSVIDLDSDHPPFATLSYVWNVNTEAKREIILCGGQALSLTRNGYDALRHLRERLGSLTIWIDAICTDETNHKEKLNQVRLMGCSSLCFWATGQLGRIQESSSFAQRKSAIQGYARFLANNYRLCSHGRIQIYIWSSVT